jgi:hypothetical protein
MAGRSLQTALWMRRSRIEMHVEEAHGKKKLGCLLLLSSLFDSRLAFVGFFFLVGFRRPISVSFTLEVAQTSTPNREPPANQSRSSSDDASTDEAKAAAGDSDAPNAHTNRAVCVLNSLRPPHHQPKREIRCNQHMIGIPETVRDRSLLLLPLLRTAPFQSRLRAATGSESSERRACARRPGGQCARN